MKKTARVKSSARKIGRDTIIRLKIDDENHVMLCRFACHCGLTVNQIVNFLINWAGSQDTLTPTGSPWSY